MFAGDDETTHHGLTDYELERVAHIRRNREIMKQLGLGDHDIVRAARERCGDVGDASSTKKKTKKRNRDGVGDDVGDGNGNGNGDDDAGNDQKSTKKNSSSETVEAGIARVLRRSRRLLDKPVEHDGTSVDDPEFESKESKSKYLAGYEIDALHEADAAAYAKRNAGCQEKVSVVGTASYQHTLMRVRTMSEPALKNRIAAIERAKGKHAVVKMRLFARVTFLEGLEALARSATEAFERLVAELGDPEEEEEGM